MSLGELDPLQREEDREKRISYLDEEDFPVTEAPEMREETKGEPQFSDFVNEQSAEPITDIKQQTLGNPIKVDPEGHNGDTPAFEEEQISQPPQALDHLAPVDLNEELASHQ